MSRSSWFALVLAAGLVAALVVGWRPMPLRAPRASLSGVPQDLAAIFPKRQVRIPELRHREPQAIRGPWIEGRVEDADGQPIVEGKVRLYCLDDQDSSAVEGTIHVLDEYGIVRGPGCPTITCAEFVHPSMIQSEAWVLRPGRSTVLRARPLARQRGQVIDARGEPVSGAHLFLDILNMSEWSGIFTSQNTVADGDGFFSFALAERPPCDPCRRSRGVGLCSELDGEPSPEQPPPQSLELLARADGFRFSRIEVNASEKPWRIELADPGEAIVGRLVDATGGIYPRAKILARSSEQPAEIHHASIDGADFEFSEVGPGTYELRAVQDGIELATAEAVAGIEVELVGSIPAAGVDLTLRVLDGSSGDPLVGVRVDGGPFGDHMSDLRGEIRATEVLPGTYTLRLQPPGGVGQRRPVTVSEGESKLTLSIEIEATP